VLHVKRLERSQRGLQLSLFEKVILANSLMLIGEALAALWVTSHTLETHHYLIDTGFLVLATVISLAINIVLLFCRPIRRSVNWPRLSIRCSIDWRRCAGSKSW
jgi:hypothetical protein